MHYLIFGIMFQRCKNWYNSLRAQHKLMLSFALHWVYWFVIWLVFERFIFNEQRSLAYHLFHATFMAFVVTIPFNWQKVKALFRKKQQQMEG